MVSGVAIGYNTFDVEAAKKYGDPLITASSGHRKRRLLPAGAFFVGPSISVFPKSAA
jgi:hypothetical protein